MSASGRRRPWWFGNRRDAYLGPMRVFLWEDVSPIDGCTLVQFAMAARSVADVSDAVSGVPHAQNRTVNHLRKRANIRVGKADGNSMAADEPGVIFFRDGDSPWRRVS